VTITVLVHVAEEGGYWAEVPQCPGCATQGDNWDELRANALEAVAGWFETTREEGLAHPWHPKSVDAPDLIFKIVS